MDYLWLLVVQSDCSAKTHYIACYKGLIDDDYIKPMAHALITLSSLNACLDIITYSQQIPANPLTNRLDARF